MGHGYDFTLNGDEQKLSLSLLSFSRWWAKIFFLSVRNGPSEFISVVNLTRNIEIDWYDVYGNPKEKKNEPRFYSPGQV